MSNDLTTLSGALLEMKDELIYQLGQKGVTASYSSTDGLLGLIGRIADIQTGGGGSCYHIEFDQASYTTNGTVTVSATVLKNYAPCTGETVTFTSSTSTSTTATTDSNGVATATITFSDSTTLTASISNVSDTATINVVSYLFYDDCTIDLTSQYTNTWCYRYSGTLPSLSFDSSTNGYTFGRNTSKDTFSGYLIPNIRGNNIKVTCKVKLNNSSSDAYNQFGIGFSDDASYTAYSGAFAMFRIRGDNRVDLVEGQTDSSISTSYTLRNAWRYVEISKTGSTVNYKVYDENKSQLTNYNYTLKNTYTNPYFFFVLNNNTSNTKYVKEIKVESIS